eukprot:scaffold85272_cov72-Phaeocystis_antarctica.AAC.4
MGRLRMTVRRVDDSVGADLLQPCVDLIDAPRVKPPVAREADVAGTILKDRPQHIHARLAEWPVLRIGSVQYAVDVQEENLVSHAYGVGHCVDGDALRPVPKWRVSAW